MNPVPKFTLIGLLVLVLGPASSAMAVSFSADMITKRNGRTETTNFYLWGSYYRMEVAEDGKPMVIIADRKKNVHRFLNMAEKVFFEIPSDDFRILSNDPFKASEYMVSKYGSHVEGDEKINGIDCERQAVIVQDTKIHSRWVSKKLKIPVKLISYDGKKASYETELLNIREIDMQKDLFAPPVDFKQVEEPGAAEKRKHEEQREAEEALPGLTAVKSTQAPCYVKIAGGGELRLQLDTDRKAYLEITNQVKGESEFAILHYRSGKPTQNQAAKTGKLEGLFDRASWTFNDEFAQKAGSFLVDELRIKLQQGVVYVELRQSGVDRTDIYNRGGSQTDADADPKRPLTVAITGDNPFGDQTIGKFWLRYQAGASSEAIPFTVATGTTRKWQYPAEKGVRALAVTISKGDGRAKISLVQPPVPKKSGP